MATVLTRPTIKELTDALSDKVDWYELGIKLDISLGTLNAIEEDRDTVKRRLIAMLEKWLNKYPERGWSDVISALRSMERNDVADYVAGKYCNSTDGSSQSVLGIHNLAVVFKSIGNVATNWKPIGCLLGIDDDTLTAISNDNSESADKCLIDMVTCWLQHNYDTSCHGLPTWEKLVQVIASPAGGNNATLALTIVQQHNVSIQQATQTHVAHNVFEPSQENSQFPLYPSHSTDTYVGTSLDGSQPVTSRTVVEGTPYITLHPQVELLPPDLSYIEDELLEVIKQFESNVYETQKCFEESAVPINNIHIFLKRKKRSFVHQIKKKQAENEIVQTIQKSNTYDDLFDLLLKYVSWFNYEIFTALISTFMKNNQQIQISWKAYEEKLKEYLSLGKGVRVVSSPTIRGLPEDVGTKVMIVKVEQEDHVYNDLALFRKAVAKALNQSDFFLYLCTIDTGCVELRFVIPDFLLDEIFPLTSQQINITLPNLGIIAIYCDKYHVRLPQVTTPPLTLYHNYVQNALCEFHDQLKMENTSSSLHDACYKGSLSEVQWILQKFGYENYERGDHGWTPLHSAAYGGHFDVLYYLIDSNKCDPNVSDDDDVTLLHMSSYKGHISIVTYLIDACNVLVDAADCYNTTAVMYAALGGQDEAVNLLISKYQCDTSVCSRAGYTLSLLACQSGQKKVVDILESLHLFDPQSLDYMGRGVILYACTGGSVEILKYLIQHYNLELTVQDHAGMRGLHIAARYGRTDIVQYIMKELGPQVALETDNNSDDVIYALATSYYIPMHSAKIFAKLCSPLTDAACYHTPHTVSDSFIFNKVYFINLSPTKVNEKVSLMSWMLEQCSALSHFNIDALHSHGRRLVHAVCHSGSISLVKILEQYNANFNILDDVGKSALHYAALSGSVTLFKYLVQHHHLDPSAESFRGELPLHDGCRSGGINMVQYLANINDVNFQDVYGMAAIFCSSLSGHYDIVRYLIENHKINLYTVNIIGENILHMACCSGNIQLVKYLIIDKAMDTSVKDYIGRTLLHRAANIPLVKLLEKYRVDPHQGDKRGYLPMHAAAEEGHTDIIRHFLSQCHVNVAMQTVNGYNVVHCATKNGHYHTTEYLSTVYIDGFSVPDNDGVLPIHTACQSGNIQLVEYLVDEGCDIRSLTNSHQSCAAFACMSDNLDLLKLLVCKYALNLTAPDKHGFTLLHYAAEKGHNHIIEWLVEEHKLDPRSTSNDATTTLHKAASGGVADTVKYLYEKYSLDINSTTTTNKYTPLHSATEKGHIPVVQYLTKLPQCNVTAKDSNGSTVLHLSSKLGSVKLLKHFMENYSALLEKSNLYNDKNYSPLDVSCICGNMSIVKYIMEDSQLELTETNKIEAFYCASLAEHSDVMHYLFKNASKALIPSYYVSFKGISNITPCHVVCGSGNLDVVKVFVEAVINSKSSLLTESNDDGYNIFHFAAANRSLSVMSYLIDFLSDTLSINSLLEAKTNKGHTPLYLSCANGHISVAKLLATSCPSTISMVDNNGRGLMHAVAHSNNVELIEYLADEHRFKSDAMDNTGVTPLHIAAEIGNFVAFKVLVNYINKSGNCNPVSHDGKTPFSLACENGHYLITSYLVEDLKVLVDVSSTTSTTYTPLHSAASNNKVATVQLLVEKFSVDVNFSLHEDNSTPLHLATIQGHVAVVLYLTRLPQCNVTATLTDGSTVLHLSSKHGHYHLVKHFVKNHQQLLTSATLYDNSNMTPLHYAYKESHLSIIQCLTEQGHLDTAPVLSAANTDGCNIIHCASKCSMAIMEYLINCLKSKDLVYLCEARNSLGQTPLYMVCMEGNIKVVKSLATLCPSTISMVDNNGRGLMHAAAHSTSVDLIKYLAEEHNFTADSPDNDSETPLHIAAKFANMACFSILTNYAKGSVNLTSQSMRTPLHNACEAGKADIAMFLVSRGISILDADKDRYTSVHMACMSGNKELVGQLLYRLNPKSFLIVSKSGVSLLKCAVVGGNIDVVKILVEMWEVKPTDEDIAASTNKEITLYLRKSIKPVKSRKPYRR